jgi:hypothetical protein
VRVKPVSVFFAVTVAPGSAARCASVIVPITVAVSCWAARGASAAGIPSIAASAAMKTYRIAVPL